MIRGLKLEKFGQLSISESFNAIPAEKTQICLARHNSTGTFVVFVKATSNDFPAQLA